jgi:hypothetical protein
MNDEHDLSNEWNEDERRMYEMALFATNVIAMSQQRMMMDEIEIQTLESIWNLPSPGDCQ